ncbi:MAG: heavy metal-responsive transcriptional regulator [Symploca sp. SIO1A3]|nr:heavy metal-responsive transcriptional regulator [Symploca sp. SIO1A3]
MSNSALAHQLKIGEVANQSGLPVKTIRYYEEIGLLAPATIRSTGGYRLFTNQVFNRLAFIKRSQSLGLSLSEIRDILNIYDSGELPCGTLKQHLLNKIEVITQQIEALEVLKSELQGIVSGWQEQPPSYARVQTICPNIQRIEEIGGDKGDRGDRGDKGDKGDKGVRQVQKLG